MKRFGVAAALLTVIALSWYLRSCSQASVEFVPASIFEQFQKWASLHQRRYASPADRNFRLMAFYRNAQMLVQLRSSGIEYQVALNKFADLTEEEFVAKYARYDLERQTRAVSDKASELLASTGRSSNEKDSAGIDWVAAGVVNPIRDQLDCSAGWAFSAVSAIESRARLAGYPLYALSEQELVDCSYFEGNRGCSGGSRTNSYYYVRSKQGLQTASSYPYVGFDQLCKSDSKSRIKINIFGEVDIDPDCSLLQKALDHTPATAAIAANAIQFYSGGIFSNRYCGATVNQGVNVVGYGTDSKTKKDFWLVRNSWGSSWGEAGYIKMDKSADIQPGSGICGICLYASYPAIQ